MQIYVFSAENRMLTAKNNTSVQVFYDAFRPTHAPTRLTGIAQRGKQKAGKGQQNARKVYLCGTLDELSCA